MTTWTKNPTEPDWYWWRDRADSPWVSLLRHPMPDTPRGGEWMRVTTPEEIDALHARIAALESELAARRLLA